MDKRAQEIANHVIEDIGLQREFLARATGKRATDAAHSLTGSMSKMAASCQGILAGAQKQSSPFDWWKTWAEYSKDTIQRSVLMADALRQWSDMQIAHEAAGSPPVLTYDYEVVMEGRDLPRPSNYVLLRITPPTGVHILDTKRPYIIIDPRAGHGAGIGGFKHDSQVGVALADGHPVYFVAFHHMPEEGQTIADVTHSEAAFVKKVQQLHPDSPKPIVIGNCQGGWATAILAATHPELTGPIVLNGAPMSYWAGKLGEYPMRYSGGVMGGVTSAIVASDLSNGYFDGANLVLNFELQNPGRNWFRKYYDLFADIDNGVERFLEFERWWGAFYTMTTEEIRWIVENLFIGNRLGKNEAQLEPGVPIDLKAIRAPIICFSSHGDNITPPAQALNWILDTYADEREIEISGQRIIYLLHDEIGHLGIFVSSKVAKKEHHELVSTLQTIEAFPPGLYEMRIEDHRGDGVDKRFEVSFASRTFDDILKVTGLRRDEAAFAGATRQSEAIAETYETTLRPLVQALGTPTLAKTLRETSPMRTTRKAFASGTPASKTVEFAAEKVRPARTPADPANPFVHAERLWADIVETNWNMLRDVKEAMTELSFFSMWASPPAFAYGAPLAHTRYQRPRKDLTETPAVADALSHIHDGGLPAGIVRLLLYLAATRTDVRLDRLERSSAALTSKAPFKSMDPKSRAELIHREKLIALFAGDKALLAVPDLIKTEKDKRTAKDILTFVIGAEDEMTDATRTTWQQLIGFLDGTASKTAAQ